MNKPSWLFVFLNLYTMIVCTAFSAPILLFPNLASSRSLSTFEIAVVFSAFPMGAFPSSLIIGKLMRFYRKDKLLLILNMISALARFSFGLLDFIDDSRTFFIVAIFVQLVIGIGEGSLIPIIFSLIPDLFPEEIMVKFGILEIWGTIGLILGCPLASGLYGIFGYFGVFTIMSSINLISGMFIIICFLRTDEIVSFKTEEKKAFPMKTALFGNKWVLLNFFYLFTFNLPAYIIIPGYQAFSASLTADLTESLLISAIIYSVSLVGMVIGVFGIKTFDVKSYEKRMMFIFGILIMTVLMFYGPDPVFEITDNTTAIIIVSFSFILAGISMEVIFLIISKEIINELLVVFPNEKELCSDFATGMYTACFTLDQFFGPLLGSFLNFYFGYQRSCTFLALLSLPFFTVYWVIFRLKKKDYHKEEEETEEEEEEKKLKKEEETHSE